MKPLSPSPFVCVNFSRRHALGALSRHALVGSVLAGAGAFWPSGLVRAAAPNPATASADRRRLVSVGGGVTEMVYALGAQGLLVGTDTTSLYPAAAQATPKVGYLRQLSAEGLLSLRPHALVAAGDAGPPVVIDQLRRAGVQVELVPADHTWEEVRRKVDAVGRAAAREAAAQALRGELDAQWQAVQARVNARQGTRPRVLFVLSHTGSPLVSGEGTAAHAVLTMAGARNALSGFQGYRPMTAESMAMAAPDVVLMTTQGVEALGGEARLWQRPDLALTPAYRRRERGGLLHWDALALLGFGPRHPQTVAQLHERLGAA